MGCPVVLILAPLALVACLLLLVLWPSWLIRLVLQPLLPQVLFCGSGRRRQLAITIDDGPSWALRRGDPTSLELLDLLRRLQVPATFFLIGEHLERGSPQFVARALAEGHSIGNHLQRDRISAFLDGPAFIEELCSTEQSLRRAAAPRPLPLHWLRPGGGWVHPPMLRRVRARGYRTVLGSVFPWDTFHPPLAFQRWFVARNAHPGAVLVLHDRPDTIAATLATLAAVVPELQGRGYRFVGLDQLVADDCVEDA
ncbi:polysaccharide deacetylase family protein [Cyanobium sp. Aljojuca 7D2]|uniref:polysaccharide deacetylase family protein n=1 Tax=Cyanobium sp. Aljojuca 7D2 TaxID=2823698 RepID=UPI0020CB9DFA|nr:polysaccharide deacetylase family protein [Cyanobium sp. Aljojuca 7D2]